MAKKKPSNKPQQLPSYQSPWAVLRKWPKDFPIAFLGGTGRFAVLALDWWEVAFADFLTEPLFTPRGRLRSSRNEAFLPFQSGYFGLLSYDAFSSGILLGENSQKPCRLFRVEKAVVFDQWEHKAYLVGGDANAPANKCQALSPRFTLRAEELLALWTDPAEVVAEPLTPWPLRPLTSDASYLADCQEAIAEISAGRYYQINLLRYFALPIMPERGAILSRLEAFGGPHAAWLEVGNLRLVSFSPERFIKLAKGADGLVAETFPIKGTRPRFADPAEDARARQDLATSPKDRSELNMIVDLMRNDLNRISRCGTVGVQSPGEVLSLQSVHHLVAHITAEVSPSLCWQQFFAAVCPGGSITGAPKQEVMLAIAQFEKRRRGYFMGNLFFKDDCGTFDSSILIRTLVGEAAIDGKVSWEYAAGSGIVIASKPAEELAEIAAKCRVVTAT